eukprot:CAMPEP_0194281196 /NCGR_PEP_ID=MMETSP0169-20130528/20200_1 /TAXON_ID=218684 /ORGANISM="Corethron pennatum, Strain L29A3" /LENGTH=101 /DNA_ID=CAMNT_0039026187 /DNA_START=91 /DNA_END=393 /DNA_ORIENTATION=+
MPIRTTADRDGDSAAVPPADDFLIHEVISPADPLEVPTDLINEALPRDILKMTFKMLPVSNRFLSPVCRRFRDLYGEIHKGKKSNYSNGDIHTKEKRNKTY